LLQTSVLPARSRPLQPRLTAAEIEAHRAFVATLGAGAIWLRY
jgi:DNA polymerase-3 subunit epsilon